MNRNDGDGLTWVNRLYSSPCVNDRCFLLSGVSNMRYFTYLVGFAHGQGLLEMDVNVKYHVNVTSGQG